MSKSRNTVQRSLVLYALSKLDHPNAEEIYAEVIKKRPNVSMGTVYRNLSLLSDSGEILKISVPGGADRYDLNIGLHCHFACTLCRKVYDIESELSEELVFSAKNSGGHYVKGCNITYIGICSDCMMYNRALDAPYNKEQTSKGECNS